MKRTCKMPILDRQQKFKRCFPKARQQINKLKIRVALLKTFWPVVDIEFGKNSDNRLTRLLSGYNLSAPANVRGGSEQLCNLSGRQRDVRQRLRRGQRQNCVEWEYFKIWGESDCWALLSVYTDVAGCRFRKLGNFQSPLFEREFIAMACRANSWKICLAGC